MKGKLFSFNKSDSGAIIAALKFILTSAVRFKVTSEALHSELLQLGIPSDIIAVITSTYKKHWKALHTAQLSQTIRGKHLSGVDYRIDRVLASNTHPGCLDECSINLTFDCDGIATNFKLDTTQFRLLHLELKACRDMMDQEM